MEVFPLNNILGKRKYNYGLKEKNMLKRMLPFFIAITLYVNLPYTASVSQGQWMNITPAFKMIQGKFYYHTILKIHEVQLFGDRRFAVKFTYCTSTGDWYDHEFINEWDVPLISNTIKFENLSCMAYGRMAITNLYGDPSPPYKYTISLDNPIP